VGSIHTNQNFVQEEIKNRLNLGNVCCPSFQNLLSFCLLSKKVKFKIHETIILPIVLYGCETWSHAWRDDHRLRV
jgi:hypothetical protein